MINQDKINLIKKLYKEGKSKTAIAKITHSGIKTVKKYTEDINQADYDTMIGKKFGKLTVLKRVEKNKNFANRCFRYLCKCECGNITEVNGNSLRTGHTMSCGCSRKKKNIKDLTGCRFGSLNVQKFINVDDERRAVWECICDCGKTITVNSHQLLSYSTTSCGCRKTSIGEFRIEELLKNLLIDYKKEYRIQDCKDKLPLPFDFAIFENKKLIALIEYQGNIHFTYGNGWNTKESFIIRKEHEKIKREYCKKNNIKLIEITYKEYNLLNEEYLKEKIYE